MSFKHLVYMTFKASKNTMEKLDLTRLCDACGKMIDGFFKYCPKCNICFARAVSLFLLLNWLVVERSARSEATERSDLSTCLEREAFS